jgi:hypothetical protein
MGGFVLTVRVSSVVRTIVTGGFAVSLLACFETPPERNSVTSPTLPIPTINVRDTIVYAVQSPGFKRYTAMDAAYNLVGAASGRTAIAAVEFYPSYLPLNDTMVITSAKVRLLMATSFGNPSGTLRFTAHRIQRSWLSYTLTWDTVQAGFYESTVRGTYTGTGGPDSQWVEISLDTAMVREWFSTSSSASKYGFVLVPDPSSTVIRGFHSTLDDTLAWHPSLQVTSPNYPGATAETTLVFPYGMDTFVGDVDQTVTLDPALIQLQAGVMLGGSVKFDLSFIPRGSTVLLSELFLERDLTSSWLSASVGDTSISGHLILAEGTPPTFQGVGTVSTRPTGTANTYKIVVTSAAQSWVRGPNYGMVLQTSSPALYQTMGMITFHSHTAADPAHRPRLKVVYGTQAE